MKILVDADACPVKDIIIRIAKQINIPVIMIFDTSHIYEDGYSEVITVDKGRDSVDLALANRTLKGDVVITQDYGLAALVLAKGAVVLDQNGRFYTEGNIDKLLFERHLAQKVRRSGGRIHGVSKRTKENDMWFEEALKKALNP